MSERRQYPEREPIKTFTVPLWNGAIRTRLINNIETDSIPFVDLHAFENNRRSRKYKFSQIHLGIRNVVSGEEHVIAPGGSSSQDPVLIYRAFKYLDSQETINIPAELDIPFEGYLHNLVQSVDPLRLRVMRRYNRDTYNYLISQFDHEKLTEVQKLTPPDLEESVKLLKSHGWLSDKY